MASASVVVVIPVYKKEPSRSEEASLRQALRIFSSRDVALATYAELDISRYRKIFTEEHRYMEVKYFAIYWFHRLRSYSQLLMRPVFYQAFPAYEFIQIYQLDAWVFRDELDYWCGMGYSFIGAPLADRKPFCVGNGGYSLRRIDDCMRIMALGRALDSLVPYENPRLHDDWGKLNWKGRGMAIARYFGLFRSYCYFLEKSTLDEDAFWGTMAPDLDRNFRVPKVEVAARYAWDANPSLFWKMLGGQLPSGCHAWEKWDYGFWEKVGAINYVESEA